LNGIFAILAAVGGAMYIVSVVGSVFFGKKIADTPRKAAPAAVAVKAPVAAYGSSETIYIPGTIVLVSVFFVSFVLYYFVNWKYLAEVWPLR
jgi:cytochrome c oxidase subunit 1